MSTKQTELAIQNALADRLGVIEPGMKLIKENYHLQNSAGTRGFVDILARDRHGIFVPIEVKKSDNTAREAIHEVLKYCELLRRERGMRVDQVRAVIASTDWKELIVPFSEISRSSVYPITGVKIDVGTDFPASMAVEPVTPLPVPNERDLSVAAIRISVENRSDADEKWDSLTRSLVKVGIEDLIGVLAVRPHDGTGILHVALGVADANDPRLPAPDEDEGLEEPELHAAEYRAACAAGFEHPEAEVTVPEKLTRYMQTNSLEVAHVYRRGSFEEWRDLIDDSEAATMAQHAAGWNQVLLRSSANTSHSLAWGRFRARVDYVLEGNPDWTQVLRLWLDEVEHQGKSLDVLLQAYNPADFLASLIHGYGGDLRSLIPEISGAVDAPRGDGKLIHGLLTWDGRPIKDLWQAIHVAYPTVADWGMARAVGGVYETDMDLLRSLGLRYSLFEFLPGDSALPSQLIAEDGNLRRIPSGADGVSWPGVRPLQELLQHVDFGPVVESFRQCMTPVDGGDQWIVSG
ncbi:endonuclease NucS domain-containing protein [Streptomyces sp. NPDC006259]|uniref:endonuclease NucS domain-containing protein n=1 Tax=Streptomyces sp. NPDC006259 TaxID=3364740 RepID=UPI003695BBD2